MADNKNVFTRSAVEKLEAELEDLKVVKRKEIAAKIKEAREQGDLSENAEYDAAKDEQRDIEARIDELEELLKNVEILDESEIDLEKVHLGCKVELMDVDLKQPMSLQIVAPTEVDSLLGKISAQSPVGKELMYKSVGDVVDIETPGGVRRLKVLEVIKSEEL